MARFEARGAKANVALLEQICRQQGTLMEAIRIEEVWVRPGRYGEKLVLKISDVPDKYLDSYSMKPVVRPESDDWEPLFEITGSSAKRRSRN